MQNSDTILYEIIVIQEFRLKDTLGAEVGIYDHLDAYIDSDNSLRYVLSTFAKKTLFFLRVDFEKKATNDLIDVITSDVSIYNTKKFTCCL